MNRLLSAAAALLLTLAPVARAQMCCSSSPPPNPAYGISTTAGQRLIPKTNLMTWTIGTPTLTATNNSFAAGTGAFLLTIELEDGATGVRLGFANSTATPYTVTSAVMSPSSRFAIGFNPSGGPASDLLGTTIPAFMPVTFASAGANAAPFPSAGTGFFQPPANGPEMIYPYALNGAQAGGSTTLVVSAVQPGSAWASYSAANTPNTGWYVSDGLGCIAPGTTVTSITLGTTFNITPAVTAVGCLTNQSIYLSRAPLGSRSLTIAASTNAPQPTLAWSDWMPLITLPRIDAPVFVGMTATHANIPGGTTVTAVTDTNITLSQPTTGTTLNTAVTFSIATTATATIPSGAFVIPVADASKLAVGQTVSGTGIGASTVVWQVCNSVLCADPIYGSSYIRLHTAATGAIASGTTLTFSIAGNSQTAGNVSVLAMESPKSGRRLLTVRGFISGAPTVDQFPNNSAQTEHLLAGLPDIRSGVSTAVDCVNLVSACVLSGAGSGNPVALVQYLADHEGISGIATGDSQTAGTTTYSAVGSYPRIAANALSIPNVFPVTMTNVAYGGQAGNVYLPWFYDVLRSVTPSWILMQGETGNGFDSFQSYFALEQGLRSYARSTGAAFIYDTGYPRQAHMSASFFVAAPGAVASTSVPLQISGFGSTIANGSNYALTSTSPGCVIPASTTATVAFLASSITASAPVTCPAGSLVQLNVIGATLTNASTVVTLANAAPASVVNGLAPDACIVAGTTLTTTSNSTAATLSANASCGETTTLTLWGSVSPANTQQTQEQGVGILKNLAATNQPISLLDTWGLSEDPANPTYWQNGYSVDGLHPGDFTHTKIYAPALQRLLQTLIGN